MYMINFGKWLSNVIKIIIRSEILFFIYMQSFLNCLILRQYEKNKTLYTLNVDKINNIRMIKVVFSLWRDLTSLSPS
jgi:hypothetical protein